MQFRLLLYGLFVVLVVCPHLAWMCAFVQAEFLCSLQNIGVCVLLLHMKPVEFPDPVKFTAWYSVCTQTSG